MTEVWVCLSEQGERGQVEGGEVRRSSLPDSKVAGSDLLQEEERILTRRFSFLQSAI